MSTITSTEPAANVAQEPAAGLAVQDLQNMLIVIDLACQRGAFRAAELTQIGTLHDKVAQFVQSILPQEPAAAPVTNTQQPSPVTPMAPPFAPKVGI